MKIRKIIVLSIMMFLLFGTVSQKTFATETVKKWDISADESGDVQAMLTDEGELIIEGQGSMKDGSALIGYTDSENIKAAKLLVKKVEIKEGVTKIGRSAFESMSNLEEIIIASTVIEIGPYAFEYDHKIQEIELPNNLEKIGPLAFYSTGIRKINIPSSVRDMEVTNPFAYCSNLKEIVVDKNNLNYIAENNVLYSKDYNNLICYPVGKEETIYSIKNGTKEIGSWAFCGCRNMTNIEIPNSVEKISGGAFLYCSSLANIDIPSSVKKIGTQAFYGCYGLTTFNCPEGLIELGDNAFDFCSGLENINISSTVEKIGYGVFLGCSKLKEINVNTNNKYYKEIDNVLFSYNGKELVWYPQGKEGEKYIIPDGVEVIKYTAFYYCKNLNKIEIPESITTFEYGVFRGCENIQNIELPSGLKSMGNEIFNGCKNITSITIPTEVSKIGNEMFSGCTNLTEVVIPKGVTSIDENAFKGLDLNNITIICAPDSEAQKFASKNGINYTTPDVSSPEISGFNEEEQYSTGTTINPNIEDDNLKFVELYRNGEKVEDYKPGDSITEKGFYELVVKDIVGNETREKFAIGNVIYTITKKPTKTRYGEGGRFNPQGMEITATFKDGRVEKVEEYTIENGENLKIGQNSVIIHVVGIDGEEELIQSITVVENKLENISIIKYPNKRNYIDGESFDKTGMVVNAVYTNESTKEITDYEIVDGNSLQVSQNKITIRYTQEGVTKETTLTITVSQKVNLELGYEDDNGFLINIAPKTPISEFKKKLLDNEDYKVVIIKEEEGEITEGNIHTGMLLRIEEKDGNTAVKENGELYVYEVAVKGDVNGDGKADFRDSKYIKAHRSEIELLEGSQYKAADINRDGIVDARDTKALLLHRLEVEGYILDY